MKSRLVILDACVIIDAHVLGIWKQITSNYKIYIPSTVLHDEARYFEDRESGTLVSIDLQADLSSGIVEEIAADINDIFALKNIVTDRFLQTIDDGEIEAMAILKSGKYPDHQFCTGDARAIKALAVLSMGSQAISLEKLLADSRIKTRVRAK